MSYYENVYLPRLNKLGTTRQERILASRINQFENSYLPKSNYRVEFSVDHVPYIGVLQPEKASEELIENVLLLPVNSTVDIGKVITINNKDWLVLFKDPAIDKGYNKYKVYLLDRTLTWWSRDKIEHSAKINFCGRMNKEIEDIFQKVGGTPAHREASNMVFVIMSYDETLLQDCYVKIDGSNRRFIVAGFDCETIPGVSFYTLDLTMLREDTVQTATPSSFWGV